MHQQDFSSLPIVSSTCWTNVESLECLGTHSYGVILVWKIITRGVKLGYRINIKSVHGVVLHQILKWNISPGGTTILFLNYYTHPFTIAGLECEISQSCRTSVVW